MMIRQSAVCGTTTGIGLQRYIIKLGPHLKEKERILRKKPSRIVSALGKWLMDDYGQPRVWTIWKSLHVNAR